MPADTKEKTLLEQLHDLRSTQVETWASFIEAREKVELEFTTRSAGDSKPTDAEVAAHTEARAAYRAQADQLEAEVKETDKRIADQAEVERRRGESAASQIGRVEITYEPRTYERWKSTGEKGTSYYRDIAVRLVDGFTLQSTDRQGAIDRLDQHAREISIDLPKRMKARESTARSQMSEAEGLAAEHGLSRRAWMDTARDAGFDPFLRSDSHRSAESFLVQSRDIWGNPFEFRVEPNLTQGQGGYFVPPLWLIDEFIPGLRAHLIVAGLPRQMDLPMGTDSINIPKLANLTTVGYQQANNAGLPSTDWTDTVVTGNVKTVGGYSDVALQLLEQSPHQIVDEVVTTDLMSAYNQFLDQQVIAGDGLNTGSLNGGHLNGIYPATNWSGTNTVTFTASTPAPYTFPQVPGAMASQISHTRFDAQNFKLAMHGRRWFWWTTGLDGNDRPLGETMSGGRYNVSTAQQSGLQAEGLMGTLPFLSDAPVYIDNNIPITDNNGTPLTGSADIAMGGLWDDAWLMKGDLRTNVYREILSGSLGVRFQVYNYAAFLLRYGQSFAIGQGTGFSAPTGTTTSVVF